MTTTTTPNHPSTRAETPAVPARRPRYFRAFVLTLAAALAAAAAGVYFDVLPSKRAKSAFASLRKAVGLSEERVAAAEPGPDERAAAAAPAHWDALVRVTGEDQSTIGFGTAKVEAQTQPMALELTGRTAYDDTTITKVRPRFDTRVERVFASIGVKVKKGDPLVELYSNDLAKAKTDFQTKYVQWQHNLNLYKVRQTLVQTGAISIQSWVDTQNEEQKSRLEFTIALDNLKVIYEVPKEEMDPLLKGIGEKAEDRDFGSVTDKARMTLRAKTDGIVISREVVPGNYYESTDVLMEIAPLDHLWVWMNVFELDQNKVGVGQTVVIQFPYVHQEIVGKVDYVASEVSRATRAVRVRASIPNPDATLKSEMLVKAQLEIPPLPGQTVVPRLAMVSLSGNEYVFVKKPPAAGDGAKAADKFERRRIEVAQENADHVVVTRGVVPGEVVVTNGSLVLSQLYEDQLVTTSGALAH